MSEDGKEWLNQIEGVITADGLRFTGSEEAYLKFLRTFVRTLQDKADEIESSYNNGDMELCTIKVHALKSTARIIGARELSRLAQVLETAGHKGDKQTFDAHVEELLKLYRSYGDKLRMLPEDNAPLHKDPISRECLKDARAALKTYVEQMDIDAVKMILDEISMYELPKECEELFEALTRKMLSFDWEGMENLLQ